MFSEFEPFIQQDIIFEDEEVVILTPQFLSSAKYYCSVRHGARCFSKGAYAHWRAVHGNTVYFLKYKNSTTLYNNTNHESIFMIDCWKDTIHPLHGKYWKYSCYLLCKNNKEMSLCETIKLAPCIEQHIRFLQIIPLSEYEKQSLMFLRNLLLGFCSPKDSIFLNTFNKLSEINQKEIILLMKYSRFLQSKSTLLYNNTNYKDLILQAGIELDDSIVTQLTEDSLNVYSDAKKNKPLNLIVL